MSDDGVHNPATINARSRPSSISAIPRPTSGTSRHATPTDTRRAGAGSRSGTKIWQRNHTHRKSWHTNDEAPPSSFHLSQSALPGSDSLVPYAQRARDLSGVQQQLFIRNLSTRSVNDRDNIAPPPSTRQNGLPLSLPKSKTMSSLLPSPRDATPGRRLLQPLGPPLPRTQTLGNISCFGSSHATPSPRKPTAVAMRHSHQPQACSSQLDVTGALEESRMTEEEVELMRQVQREAAANRSRLRNAFEGRSYPRSRTSLPLEALTTSTKRRNETPPSVRLSVNDVANARRLEGLQGRSSSGRLFFINSTIANKSCIDSDAPRTSTTNSGTDLELINVSENNSKQVVDPGNCCCYIWR